MNEKRRIYARCACVFCIVMLILLAALQSVWVLGGSASSIMLQCSVQRTRIEAAAKDVLILQSSQEHTQAISELQNLLPIWEHTQAGLINGDSLLQLPKNVPSNIVVLMSIAQPDYQSIDAALHVIVAHPDKQIDPIEAQIVLDHEHPYVLAMTQVVNAWKLRIDDAFMHIYLIESAMVAIITISVVALSLPYWRKDTKNE